MATIDTDLYGTVTDDDGNATKGEARNGVRHMVSLSLTKVADGLIDPKLVLSWLMNALGAPTVLVGLLVPIREAGALLPQMLLAGWVQSLRYRKWAWICGCLGQGAAAAVIALAALLLTGWAAGMVICGALAVLAVSRAAASVSYKDILGKTIPKTRRGSVKGVAGSLSSAAVIVFALLLMSGLLQDVTPLAIAVGLAAVLWICAALVFSRLEEQASEPGQRDTLDFTPIREDRQFRLFTAVRGLLTVTALAPPYMVLLDTSEGALQGLGAMVLASALASFLSSYVWGRLSDWSSRRVLALSGVIGGAAMAAAVAATVLGLAGPVWVLPAILFVLMIAYQGVRSGRGIYLVDMAPKDGRASYAALANTLIGGLLLITGAIGGALSVIGPVAALCGFAMLSILGGLLALRLNEVEDA
ncbi:MFS transporter [Puniceibacterium sp. IMCC21224]|uniref:MFS transporter n=1 Tax=Puniceibacterium sp. IMCC21224 TaxID=1618204 RepID=UPI00064E0B71|nr:MFS transporter [Puniceibacterium sp. IMCC21224]KMK67903.1 hypothetical protein IMCC21224_112780 [Puniceibacterium sp. IMCC21224]